MTRRVDVLAVMDDAQCDAEQCWGITSRNVAALTEARAAVAELIAAARLSCSTDRVTDGLRAALARVGGA